MTTRKRQPDKMTAERFNAETPIGTPLRYYPIAGHSEFVETKTRSEAWELGNGAPVVLVEGRSGGVSIHHLVRGR